MFADYRLYLVSWRFFNIYTSAKAISIPYCITSWNIWKKKYKGFPDPRQHNNWAIETSRISNCVNTPFKYCDVIHPTRDVADVTMFKPMAGQLLGLCTGSTFAAQAITPFASIWVIVHLCIFIKVDTITSILVWCIHSRTSNIADLSSRSRSVQRFCNNSFVKIHNCNALAFMVCGKM